RYFDSSEKEVTISKFSLISNLIKKTSKNKERWSMENGLVGIYDKDFFYNGNGFLEKSCENGKCVRFSYNVNNLVQEMEYTHSKNKEKEYFSYNAINQVDVIKNEMGILKFDYNDFFETSAVMDSKGNKTFYKYDEDGNVYDVELNGKQIFEKKYVSPFELIVNAFNKKKKVLYDSWGRVKDIIFADGS